MIERKIQAMHRRFGTCGVFHCATCPHLITENYHNHIYYKCKLYGLSHGEATDWRLHYQACGMYGVEQDMSHWTPIVVQIKQGPRLVPTIDGQVGMEV